MFTSSSDGKPQTRSGDLEKAAAAATTTMSTNKKVSLGIDAKETVRDWMAEAERESFKSRETCCLCLPAQHGVLLFATLAVLVGLLFTGFMSAQIAQQGAVMRMVDVLVLAAWLVLHAFSVLTNVFGLFATWKERANAFTIYGIGFVAHWILDLAAMIAFIVVSFQGTVTNPSAARCQEMGLSEGCTIPPSTAQILVIVGLSLYKVLTAYAAFVMYRYRSLLKTRNSVVVIERSQIPKKSPFLGLKSPRAWKSPRERRPWPPTNIPTIKVDLASDQSSASSYSNGSGPGSAGFAVFEFAAKYPSLRTAGLVGGPTTLEPVGEKDEWRKDEQADLGLAYGRNKKKQTPVADSDDDDDLVDIPVLPKYSVVGSDKAF